MCTPAFLFSKAVFDFAVLRAPPALCGQRNFSQRIDLSTNSMKPIGELTDCWARTSFLRLPRPQEPYEWSDKSRKN
jgi:hypothetical protein